MLTSFVVMTVIFLLVTSSAYSQFYNGTQMSFGKNRIQYKKFFWTYYKFDDFDIYFYLNGRELAVSTAKYATEQIPVMERRLETGLDHKIQFLVYNNLTDLKQSNIGLQTEERYNTGGITDIVGTKVFLYFDGDQRDFERQIRAGIASILIDQAFYGTSVGSQIKNTTLFTLPEWYKNGLISYLSEDWNTEIDNRVRDGIISGKYKKISQLTGEDALYAGHMLWKYVADKFGQQALTDIVGMTQISRSIDDGFLYVIGISFKNLVPECLNYFKSIYEAEESGRSTPNLQFQKKVKKGHVYSRITISPDGKYAAYVDNDEGRYKVFYQDILTGDKKLAYYGGFRLEERIDYSYPLLAWHPDGKILAIIVERKGEVLLNFYNVEERKYQNLNLFNFEKVVDFCYSPDGRYLVCSAVQKGQSDLFLFDIASGSYLQLTNDLYDDLEPVCVGSVNTILFASDRPNEKLKWMDIEDAPFSVPQKTDLFLLIKDAKGYSLRRVTDTPLGNETRPEMLDKGSFAFLSDENGINNRYIGRFDSAISFVDTTIHYRYFSESHPVTNYSRSILDQHTYPGSDWMGQVVYMNGKYLLQLLEFIPEENPQVSLDKTSYRNILVQVAEKEKEEAEEKEMIEEVRQSYGDYTKKFRNVYKGEKEQAPESPPPGDQRIDINNYTFDNNQAYITIGGPDTTTASGEKITVKPLDEKDKFKIPKRLNYRVEYSINQMAAQLDFTSLNYFYQPFGGGGGDGFNNLGLNGFFQVGMTDLLENHRIIGGFRIPLDLNNIEYLFDYANLEGRLDKEVMFVKQATQTNFYVGFYTFIVRFRSYQLYYILKYPFSPVFAVKGTANVRFQRSTLLSTNELALREPDILEYWAGLKGEIIYDDTKDIGLNLMTGTRFKIFGEYTQIINDIKQNMFVIGLDIRNYQRIHRSFIWANRIAASTSFGNNKLCYFMGGVDNWLAPKFSTSTPIDFTMNYTYQALATNMRGFYQNARNGNNFVVLNSELRFPVFRYFYNRPVKSDFLNNFQIVTFGDMGLAWAGQDPFSDENSFYIRYIQDGSLWIKVREQKEPLIGGFGFGARTRLLGYFLRADVAWGVEDRHVNKPIFYISLSLDF
jgi:hypothetical protein